MLIESILATHMRNVVRRHMNVAWARDGFRPRPGASRPDLLYIHIPFCETLCPYCSFHRVRFEADLARRYFRCLRREIEIYRDLGFDFEAVYVGGGTPTVLPDELAGLLECIRRVWPVKRVSVETHPQHLTPDTIAILRDAGVDRLSVGIQTFNDGILEELSRVPSRARGAGREARERLRRVRGQFDTVNVDMIYNFPKQTLDMVTEDVDVVRDLGMDQVTFYPLMQGGSDFTDVFGKLDVRRERLFFSRIQAAMDGAYEPVSAWCFARHTGMSDEYIIAHDEYAGLGSGAFGYVDGVLYANSFDINEYIDALARSDLPIAAVGTFPAQARVRYDLLMRLFNGALDFSRLKARHGRYRAAGAWKELLFLLLAGTVTRSNGCFRLTPKGRYHCVTMMKEFFCGANRLRDFLSCERPVSPARECRSPEPGRAMRATRAASCPLSA